MATQQYRERHGRIVRRKDRRPSLWIVPSWFKRQKRQEYRARVRQLLREGKDDLLPPLKKTAHWDWW
jgi:hypothetical protein